jgi:hypothetical protein
MRAPLLALALLAACSADPVDDAAVDDAAGGEGEGAEAAEGEGEADVVGEGEDEGEGEGEGEGVVVGPTFTPPPVPAYTHGTCPTLVGAPTSDAAVVTGFATGDQLRSFRLLVPDSYDGSTPYPLMFAWHWLNASSGSFVSQGELESAIDEFPFIIVLPDERQRDNGDKVYQFDWPFAETWGAEPELLFFDDLLSCVDANFNIDHAQVHGIGVSAGALWVTYLSTTTRSAHLASVVSLSGGLGAVGFNGTGWQMEWAPQPRKFPAIVLWGGEHDWLGVDFEAASMAYRDALIGDGHFVVECVHDQGHAVPPIEPPPGSTKLAFLWRFMLDHPYAVPAPTSPWQQAGMPSSLAPSWCRLATP